VESARAVFAELGYHAAGTEEIVRRARVSRGALYHHFPGKEALFEAVLVGLSRETVERLRRTHDGGERWKEFTDACVRFLDVASEPAFRQIVLVDGPTVLGRTRWWARMNDAGLALAAQNLEEAMAEGSLPRRPAWPMSRLVMAAIYEAALVHAEADSPTAQAAAGDALRALLDGLRVR
jgi:AcrR family transcriptional regulator